MDHVRAKPHAEKICRGGITGKGIAAVVLDTGECVIILSGKWISGKSISGEIGK